MTVQNLICQEHEIDKTIKKARGQNKMAIKNKPSAWPIRLAQRWLRMRQVISFLDALKVIGVCRITRTRSEFNLTLTPIGRRVTIRANTSDVKCLEKVFVDQEYLLPVHLNAEFDVQPKFIVSAGANIGMATLYFAHAFPDAKIVAIEPESSNFELLRRNCEGIKNIKLKKAALWPSEIKLQIADPNVTNWGFQVRPATAGTPTVEAITIPQILAESGADRIDLLKLDIEGAERELFSESCEDWLPKVGMIVIELHDRLTRGCSETFYSHMLRRQFVQENCGENIFLLLRNGS
jgi:FkbM family methyltransferase